jgi:hypothetical protein
MVPGATETGRTPERVRTLVITEQRMLALSVALGIVKIVAASHATSLQRGYR